MAFVDREVPIGLPIPAPVLCHPLEYQVEDGLINLTDPSLDGHFRIT